MAGYDVYGNVGHQLVTRLYMDFLRMEGEGSFLLLLPESARIRERDFWYRDVDDEIKEYLTLPKFESAIEPAIDYQTDDEKIELFGMLSKRLQAVLPARHAMGAIEGPPNKRRTRSPEQAYRNPGQLHAGTRVGAYQRRVG